MIKRLPRVCKMVVKVSKRMKGSEDIALIGFLCPGEGASESLDCLLGGFPAEGGKDGRGWFLTLCFVSPYLLVG